MSLSASPLAGAHEEAGASFTDFGGWEMPVEFDSIRSEHEAVRESAGKFDVSHMGEVVVSGPDATALMQRLTSNDVTALEPGDSQYAAITNEKGVMLEDTIVYRLSDDDHGAVYLFVPNAGNDESMVDRWVDHRDEWDLEATVENRTTGYGMIAVQGPESGGVLGSIVDGSVRNLSRFEMSTMRVADVECQVARTGYTGEDGFEILVPWEATDRIWSALECQPCGLGSRDTLRLEAGYLLAGQEFHPRENPRTPLEAGIGFAVKLDTEFVGRDALERQHEEGIEQTLVGIRLVDRGVPRSGYEIETPDGESVGVVTSGTMSPTLTIPIGLGYVETALSDVGTKLRVVVRDRRKKAKVESLPFVETV